MAAYIIVVETNTGSRSDDQLAARLKAYPAHWHLQECVWIVNTNQTAEQIRETLSSMLGAGDRVFVARTAAEAAWSGFSEKVANWMRALLTAR